MVNSQLVSIPNDSVPIPVPKRRLKKRHLDFIKYWTDFNSDTFGNTYLSGVKAGFSPKVSRQLTSNYRNVEWIKEAKEYMENFSPLHIVSAFQTLSTSARADRDKIQALDRLAKIKGMYIERSQSEVHVQFTNTVPRPSTPITVVNDESHNITPSEVEGTT